MDIHGTAPWVSVDAAPSELIIIAHLPIPSAQEVCRCMNCPYAECRDCIGKKKDGFKEPHRPPVYDVAVIRQLVISGADSKTISRETGCAERTARRYIRKYVKSA